MEMSKTVFYMLNYLGNLKRIYKIATRKISEFNEVAGYKIDIPNSPVFLYSRNKQKLKIEIFIQHIQHHQKYENTSEYEKSIRDP